MQFINPETDPEAAEAATKTAGIVSDTLDLAVRHLVRREPWHAKPLVEQVVALVPHSAVAQRLLADAKRDLGDLAGAEGDYLAALRLDPDVAGANVGYGALLLSMDRLDEAAVQLSRAAELDVGAWPRLFELGQAFRRVGRPADALLAFQAVREIRPQMAADSLVQMGICLRALDRTADSVAAFRAALMERVDLPEAWTNLIEALHALGEPNDAAVAVRAWVRAMPNDPVAAHLAAAQAKAPPYPDAASAAFVRSFFDRMAPAYGEALTDAGRHVANLVVAQLAGGLSPAPGSLDIVDVGCGTGSLGLVLRPWASMLAGVDLSPRMLDFASSNSAYDRLDALEGLAYLQTQPQAFDLVTMVDILAHTGRVERWFHAAARAVRSDGAILVAFDAHEGDAPWTLRSDGRYAHAVPAVVAAIEEAGFGLRSLHVGSVHRDREAPARVACLLAVRAAAGRS